MAILDSLDKRLIKLMQDNSRQSSKALAKRLRVSPATVRRRTKRLIQNGVMRIMAVVDPAKLGLSLDVVIGFDIAHDKWESVMQVLADRPEITWLSSSTGRFDIIALARFRSTDELSDFATKELAKLEGVRNSETFVCLKLKKSYYAQR